MLSVHDVTVVYRGVSVEHPHWPCRKKFAVVVTKRFQDLKDATRGAMGLTKKRKKAGS
jgi:hypothetical protein